MPIIMPLNHSCKKNSVWSVREVLENTECVTDLVKRSEMIILESIFTTFKSSCVFGGSWGSIEYWLELKTKPPSGNLA